MCQYLIETGAVRNLQAPSDTNIMRIGISQKLPLKSVEEIEDFEARLQESNELKAALVSFVHIIHCKVLHTNINLISDFYRRIFCFLWEVTHSTRQLSTA